MDRAREQDGADLDQSGRASALISEEASAIVETAVVPLCGARWALTATDAIADPYRRAEAWAALAAHQILTTRQT
jgi:hypothetical protein